MNTRTLIATLTLAAAIQPAAGAQDSVAPNRLVAAVLETASAAQHEAARVLASMQTAHEHLALAQDAQAQAREQAAKQREVEARARELAARHRDLYMQGRTALDRSEWDRAREIFAKVLAEKGERADAAQYWMAYAQYKLGQAAAALDSIRSLQVAFPESRWLQDAKALELQLRGAPPSAVAATGDDELKLLALNSLMNNDSEQALPILEKLLAGPNSPQVKKRALFIISQSRTPKAREILASTAKGAANPDLQMEALQYLGISGGDENFKLLQDIYASSSDRAMKRRILEAYMVSGRKDALLRAATSEPDAELRKRAVNMLGAARATTELWDLYRREKDADVRKATLEGLFIAGDVDRLIEVVRTEKDAALRAKAIQFLGMRRDAKASALLLEIYWQPGQTAEVKKSVIDGLLIQGNATGLIDIAKKETDATLRKEAITRLSLMKSKEATDFLLELISK